MIRTHSFVPNVLMASVWALAIALPISAMVAGAEALAAGGTTVMQQAEYRKIQEIRDFKPTNSFFEHYLQAKVDMAKNPCGLSPLFALGKLSGPHPLTLSQVIAAYDAQPGVHPFLLRHALTAREMILGTIVMMQAGVQQLSQLRGATVDGRREGTSIISSANAAFLMAHKAEVAHYAQLDARASSGSIPSCMLHGLAQSVQ